MSESNVFFLCELCSEQHHALTVTIQDHHPAGGQWGSRVSRYFIWGERMWGSSGLSYLQVN